MRFIPAAAALMLLAPAAGHAACSVSVAGVGFGVYNPLAFGPQNAVGSVTVACGQFFGSYTLALSAGSNGGGEFAGRRLWAGSGLLAYQLFIDAGRAVVWGDGSGGSAVVSSATCLATCRSTYTVYGRVPARQPAGPGDYTDTMTVTVMY